MPRTVDNKTIQSRASDPGLEGPAPALTVTLPALLDADGDTRFRQGVYLMMVAFDRLQSCRDAFGRDLGLTGSQFAVLIGTSHVQGADGISIRALADHVRLASTHVTTEVGRLIRLGLLEKRPNQADRRGVLVSLSAAGQRRLDGLMPFLQAINNALFRDVTRHEMDEFVRFLTLFVRNSEDALALIRLHEGQERCSWTSLGPQAPDPI